MIDADDAGQEERSPDVSINQLIPDTKTRLARMMPDDAGQLMLDSWTAGSVLADDRYSRESNQFVLSFNELSELGVFCFFLFILFYFFIFIFGHSLFLETPGGIVGLPSGIIIPGQNPVVLNSNPSSNPIQSNQSIHQSLSTDFLLD